MNPELHERPHLVWIVLGLLLLSLLTGAYGCVEMVLWRLQAKPYITVEGIILAFAGLGVSTTVWIGLWRSKPWGWILAVVSYAYSCFLALRALLYYTQIVYQFRMTAYDYRFVASVVLGLSQFALLLSPPLREFFLNNGGVPRKVLSAVPAGGRSARLALYFLAATAAPILTSAYILAKLGRQKLGGTAGFMFFLMVGLRTGIVASLIFAIALTYTVRALNPARMWQWILVGGSMAPLLILVLTIVGTPFSPAGSVDPFQQLAYPRLVGLIFWGPTMLNSVRFIAPIAGILTAWICYVLYPWSFPQFSRKRVS